MVLGADRRSRSKRHRSLDDDEFADLGTIVAATLTLLGLIIGFSFSMAITRYDQRKTFEEAEPTRLAPSTSVRTCSLPPTRRKCVPC